MTEPAASKSNAPWMVLGIILVLGVVAVAITLGSSDGSDEGEAGEGKVKAGEARPAQNAYVLSPGKSPRAIPADAEVVVFANMQQVLRSPILPSLKLNREKLWSRMRFDSRVKEFLENSGINLDQSKSLSLIVRGLAERPKSPHVVAQWKGTFNKGKVTESFRQSLQAKDLEAGGMKVIGDEAIALHVGESLSLGNRPLFDDLIGGSKGDFSSLPAVQEVMSHLGKQGAITAFARFETPPTVKVPMVSLAKLKLVGATVEVMGAPKIRLVGVTGSEDEAVELAGGIESALGFASLGLSAKGQALAFVDLIERIKVETKGKLVIISVNVPLTELPKLVQDSRSLKR